MTRPPPYWFKAKKKLAKKDKVMKVLINKYNDKTLVTRNNIFFSLCKSIIGQQISVAAANSVFNKFKKSCNGSIRPKVVANLSFYQLKKCGLSRQKVKGIKELAKRFKSRSFNPSILKKMNDEEAIDYLTTLRQIGRWSAEMILLFTLNRPNIWPIQDIGLLRAISNNYNKKYLPPKSFVNKLHKLYSPYCSVATWYLWRSIDDDPIQY